ncbi:hypothetical protein VSS37_19100 [Candidatus Thiothrix sp. Deng01]|uniref:Amino acid transport protein n=1 Tax=Candidatus Thiothrix phosphatis TaxID=3112415 RepID=A0ABU6D1Z9_9GAMM|nr:hypothetical protein [Candidatus Thiothrix sp. Deng01]MEB4593096.1 hypothetical protein [Candidatus Thiothrix sp. Deng01]
MNTATLLWGLLFSSIGLGYFMYGRKQHSPLPLLCGLGLMAYPYFVSSNLLMVIIGGVLAALPYFIRL